MQYGSSTFSARLALGFLAATCWCAISAWDIQARGSGGGGHGGGRGGQKSVGPVPVRGYVNSKGTVVAPYSRSLPGSGKKQNKLVNPLDRHGELSRGQLLEDWDKESRPKEKKAKVQIAPKAKQPSSAKRYYATANGFHYYVENGVYGQEPIRPLLSQQK